MLSHRSSTKSKSTATIKGKSSSQLQQPLSLSSEDDSNNKRGNSRRGALDISGASNVFRSSSSRRKDKPPAPPSISFSDADDSGVPLEHGADSAALKTAVGELFYSATTASADPATGTGTTGKAQSVHPYADLDLIAETISAPHSTYASSSGNNNTSIKNNNSSNTIRQQFQLQQQQHQQQQHQHHQLISASNALNTNIRDVEDEFDPSLLHVLSSGESDVHSILSAPGDLIAHRDPFANLGLTPLHPRRDKAAQILGIPHRRSMEPIPSPSVPSNSVKGISGRFSSFGSRATGGYTNPHPTIPESGFQSRRYDSNARTDSLVSSYIPIAAGRNRAHSGATTNTQMASRFPALFPSAADAQNHGPATPLTSLYLVAGLPKSHHAWTLADPDSVLGLQHSDGAVNKWWRPEVLGSTVSPGVIPNKESSNVKDVNSNAIGGGNGNGGGGGGTPIANANSTTANGNNANGAGTSNNAVVSSSASVDTSGKKKRRPRAGTNATIPNGAGALNPRDPGAGIGLSKSQVAKMLSKSLKLSFTREVEIIASTLQPPSTVHSFTFQLPTSGDRDRDLGISGMGGNGMGRSMGDVRSSVYSGGTGGVVTSGGRVIGLNGRGGGDGMGMIASARPSSTYLGPATTPLTPAAQEALQAESASSTTYYGVCLTVWSHADEERSRAIRRTVELGMSRAAAAAAAAASANGGNGSRRGGRMRTRSKKDSLAPPVPNLPGGVGARSIKTSGASTNPDNPTPWSGTDIETEPDDLDLDGEGDGDFDGEGPEETDAGGMSESDWEGTRRREFTGRVTGMNMSTGDVAGSTLFLPGDAVFWLPYALTLVSRVPIYDLMRDFLTFSWARFSKDVHSHTLQIAKILSAPMPKPGDMVRLDASPSETDKQTDRSGKAVSSASSTLEMVCRMPGGLDFGQGLVDVNFQMWPLFCCLSLDNILTCCEIALSPTGRVLFISKHPAMLGVAVSTIKYLVELRGWNGIALPSVHSRDAKIYIDDPGPWILGLATEARYLAHTSPEVCVCDLDINYVNCLSPPPGHVSTKSQRDRYRRILLTAFDAYFHPDHSIPSEFKEAFPAGRFRPVVKIQSRRGATSSVSTEAIHPPEWWNWTRVVSAFNEVLQHRDKPPSLLKRITMIRGPRRQAKLTPAELLIQISLRKRASAFVDARDDLETKIGRLSRRLNFLLTESDLWREKFIQFEAYAEKLSGEAVDLRTKINKEQRESRRLTSLVTLTAQEKAKLQNQLYETEGAHHAAVIELERMKDNMEKMELERVQMVAEVEAQIERALQSMMVGDSDGEWDEEDLEEIPNDSFNSPRRIRSPMLESVGNRSIDSRPLSPQSVTSSHHGTRKRIQGHASRPGTSHSLSDAGKSTQGGRLRSMATATTLADIADRLEQVKQVHAMKSRSSLHGRKSRASSVHHGSERGGSGGNTANQRLKAKKSEPKLLSGEEAGDEDSGLSERERIEREKALKQVTKRFSTGAAEGGKDGSTGGDGMMAAMDEGIVLTSDHIAEKMKAIERKLETAMAAEETLIDNDERESSAPEMVAENVENDSQSDDDDEGQDFLQPAPVPAVANRPRPTRATRPSAPRPKSNADPVLGSPPLTPTTVTHISSGRRVTNGSLHADTEAWRESVATASNPNNEWRDSAVTAAVSEEQQHRASPSFKLGSGPNSVPPSPKPSLIPRLKKVASNASVGAFVPSPSSPTPPTSARTTTTMNSESMSSHGVYNMNSRFRPESRGGITTDGDSDADFQSAYSTSPRMTPIGTPIELERSSSGFGRRTSWRQSLNLVEKLQYGGLARPPSATGTVWSTGAVGGLGIIQDDTTARSRASSIGTNLEASSSTYGDRKAASHSGSSDHTIGAPEGAHERETNRSPHPPVSLATRGSSNATTKNRRDSDQMIAMPGVFPTTSL